MAELSIAFKATTKTVGLIMNWEGTIQVEDDVMKIRLKDLYPKTSEQVEHCTRLRK